MVNRLNAWMRRSMVVLFLIGCDRSSQTDKAPEKPSDAVDSRLHAAVNERAERAAEINGLIAQATTAPTTAERSAAALSAAATATDGLSNTLDAIDRAMAIIEFNLRNADVNGFKSVECNVTADDSKPTERLNVQQGELMSTEHALDIAISGDGWLTVKMPDGSSGYTRNGAVFINSLGQLVVGVGGDFILRPPITVPTGASDIYITSDGTVGYTPLAATRRQIAGQLQLARFRRPEMLARSESGIYLETTASGEATYSTPGENGCGTIVQGFLEKSNINLNQARTRLRFLANWREAILQSLASRPRSTKKNSISLRVALSPATD